MMILCNKCGRVIPQWEDSITIDGKNICIPCYVILKKQEEKKEWLENSTHMQRPRKKSE